jgi:hypothetical protein
MSRVLLTIIVIYGLAVTVMAQAQPAGEHIVVTGGVSMMEWEKYKAQPHDNWWLNFVRASRIRIQQLRQQYGPATQITWLIYQRGYARR